MIRGNQIPPLPDRVRVVTPRGMKPSKITKDKLRDFGLVALLIAGLALYVHDKDNEARAKDDYYACHSDDCRQQVQHDILTR